MGKSFWNHGSSNSRGVAILLSETFQYDVIETGRDNCGRQISCAVKVSNKSLNILNIYAPNTGTDKKIFFNESIRVNTEENNVVLGDFNCTLIKNLDRKPVPNHDDVGTLEFRKFIEKGGLVDVWRSRYPNTRQYTFCRANSRSRIDYIFLNSELQFTVRNIKISYFPYSDHDGVHIKLNLNEPERGPGMWKMNGSVIQSDIFKNILESFWGKWKQQKHIFVNKLEWWEETKVKIKSLAIEVSKKLNITEKQIKEWEKQLDTLDGEDLEEGDKKLDLQNKIKKYYDTKSEAARIRSKVNWYEKGEKSTEYFFKLEKRKGKEKLWCRVKTADGSYKDDISSILEEQVSFYEKLFTSEGWDREAAEILLNNLDKKLNQEDQELCDQDITLEELSKAVNMLKPNKSPGEDGIVSEFYKTYWYLIGEDFESVVQEIFDQQLLCESQYRGMITLMFKSGEREDIKNWRPITLLNTDYKIISKLLAERLKVVLPNIINTDQKGFVKGRNIFQGNRLLQDIIDYTDIEDEEGAIIFLDQQKAFDRAEWEWIDLCLEKFGFGKKFRGWVKMLCKFAKTCVQTNGFTSRFVTITRSIRQGCPIAPMLYILQAEPFAASVRSNPNIIGISLPNRQGENIESKLNMFADDTQLINKTEESILETFKILGVYEKASGAKMNLEKTVGMYLGRWRNKRPQFKNIKWTTKPVKALGVYHGYGVDLDKIWLEKIKKIKSSMEVWKSRDLTYTGKTLIIKSFVLSVIGYEIEMRGIPERYEKEINDAIWSFVWDGKTNQISRNVSCLPSEKGGMGMVNLRNFIKAKQVKCMYSLINTETDKWNAIGKFWLTAFDEKFDTDFFLCKCSEFRGIGPFKMSKYYVNLLNSWSDFQNTYIYNSKEDLLNENIFGNRKLKFNGHALFLANFSKSGIKKVKDIWDENAKSFKHTLDIFNKLIDKRNWIAEYSRIKASFKPDHLTLLKADNIDPPRLGSPFLVEDSLHFVNRKGIIQPKKLSLKNIQYFWRDNTVPNCQLKWNLYFETELQWENIWKNVYNNFSDRKSKQLQWKFIHNIIYTEERLQKMNRSNGCCHFCKEKETLLHLFVHCKLVDEIWEYIFEKITELCVQNGVDCLQKTEQNIIFGIHDKDDIGTLIINTIIFLTKWVIWKKRNIAKYQKKVIVKLELMNTLENEIAFVFSTVKRKMNCEHFSNVIDIFCK